MSDQLQRTYARMGAVARIANRGGLSRRDRALVRLLRSSMCYRANKLRALGGNDAHASVKAIPHDQHPGASGPDRGAVPGDWPSDHPVRTRPATSARVPSAGGFAEPRNHDEQLYNAAHGLLTFHRDSLPTDQVERLEQVRAELVEKLERQQPIVTVRDAVQRLTEQGPSAGAQTMTGANKEQTDAQVGGDTC